MVQKHSLPKISVRPLDPAMTLNFLRMAVAAFSPAEDVETAASRWRQWIIEFPSFRPEQLRGAYEGDVLLGGYLIHERPLLLNPGTTATGCIGAVVTHPDHRGRGVARLMMEDAIVYADEHRMGLLLLDGIGGFYHRWGYIDVLEEPYGGVKLDDIRRRARSSCPIRLVTMADAPAMLTLYRRHFDSYVGCFDWSVEMIEHRLRYRTLWEKCFVAERDGGLSGYLWINPTEPQRAREVVADDWPTALALLHEHAALFPPDAGPDQELQWPLAPDSHTFHLLTEKLPVRLETQYTPGAYWLARIGHLPALLSSLQDAWRQRWSSALANWTGEIVFQVGASAFRLALGPGKVDIITKSDDDSGEVVRLTPQAFTQLVFGYRPIHWYAHQPELHVPHPLIPILQILFPSGHGYIPGTDHF